MKKMFIFILVLLVSMFNVYAYSKLELVKKSEGIDEEIFPIRDDNSKLEGIYCIISIPEDYENQKIIIRPDIFGGIGEYKNIEKDDKIDIILEIKNNSSYNYSYVDNSFYLGTKKLTNMNNYQNTFVRGFDKEDIYDFFSPYRIFNTAIASLFNNKEFNNKDLSDYNLELKLIENGYKGLDEINKYYLDFYNKKYNLSVNSLDSFNYDILREMFEGEVSTFRETNKEIIELVYNNYFVKTIYFDLDNVVYDSIGNYMENNLGNDFFNNRLNLVQKKDLIKINMSLTVNNESFLSVYKNYNYVGDFYFILEKKDR